MVFSSLQFILIFMPVFFTIYYLVPNRYRNIVLLLGSLSFYAVGTYKTPGHFVIFIVSMLTDYSLAMLMTKRPSGKRLFLIAGIIFHILALGFYKYFNFIINELAGAFPNADIGLPFTIILPIGISFYTFQGLSYLIDVYRGTVDAERSPLDFCVYISMFAQLIAGPIVNYSDVANELHHREIRKSNVLDGFGTFIFGMGLKVLLANPLGKLWTNSTNIGFESLSTPLAWMSVFAYSFQIYFDFFGYSLMAIGLGKMMGFNLPKNFDFPYLSTSMTEFWRRWHITLGSWFREYVYIPLGGSRKGTAKTIRNLFVVWLLTGIWHGAGYNFMVWGMMLFAIIAVEKYFIGDFLERHPVAGHLYMLFLIPMSWAVFEVGNMHQLGMLFKRLFPFFGQGVWSDFRYDYVKYLKMYWPFFLAAILLSTHLPFDLLERLKASTESSPRGRHLAVTPGEENIKPVCKVIILVILSAIFFGGLYCMYRGYDDPFLYFRF